MAASMMGSRPPQLGGQEDQPQITQNQRPTLQQDGCHTPQSQSASQSECTTSASTSTCRFTRKRRGVRRYPEHFCVFERCCYKFSDEGALLARDFEHLPVCHSWCFGLERNRLRQNAKEAGTQIELDGNLPLCHRQCYMKALLKANDPNWVEREVVPRNRVVEEYLRIPMLTHLVEEIRESWRQMEHQRRRPEGVGIE